MTLAAGVRLGAYEVIALIGAGGMGEVYRARDTKLGRDVAIKVLPDGFAADAERVARFQREAHLLASLNHPNIAHIHGLEEAGASKALVLELIEGFTLADRIEQGPVPLDEALAIAKQVAAALEAAHEHGIVHRDLKPANIKITEDGLVKVLDFGLAKAADGVHLGPEVSASPTITSPIATIQGVLLGTAAYMSPEQARGKPADKRADIWAFGCVLFEMLTGRRAFEGEEVSDILAAILRSEPMWTLLPAATPPGIAHVLRRCLEKDRKKRAADIADVLFDLNESLVRVPPPLPPAKTAGWKIAAAVLTGTAIGVLGTIFIERRTENTGAMTPVTRSLLDVAPADQLRADANDEVITGGLPTRTTLALSPDGRFVVFSGAKDGSQQLFLRALDQLAAVPIIGTENGRSPFFSPDGEWVGFWSTGWLRKIPVRGGPATGICQTPPIIGASWSTDDSIVFARGGTGLFRVSATGGSPQSITTVDSAKGELSHRHPHVLPGNRGVLFTVTRTPFPAWDDTTIDLQDLNSGERKTVIEGGADARYVGGHLVYMRRGTLMAAPFSLESLTAASGAVAVVSGVMQAANTPNTATESGAGQFATSASGTLAYVSGSLYEFPERMLFWIDRDGREELLKIPPKPYIYPRLSPDGSQIAIATQGDRSIWIHDLSRNTQAKLTSEGRNIAPVWSPDGQSIAFGSATVGEEHLVLQRLESGGAPQRLTPASDDTERPAEWSKSANALVYTGLTNQSYDIRVLENGKTRNVVSGRSQETYPAVSPDGLWLAYTSNESGRNEVYVVPFTSPGRPTVISTNGGAAPSWHPKGGELFYVEPLSPTAQGAAIGSSANRMMSVSVTTSPRFTAGAPRRLFETRFLLANVVRGYDISPDGRRFLMVRNQDRPLLKPDRIVLVQNWARELTPTLRGR